MTKGNAQGYEDDEKKSDTRYMKKCAKDISSPLKAYAAALLELRILPEEGVRNDIRRPFKNGEEQGSRNIGLDHSAEWIYVQETTGTMQPTQARSID